MDFSDVVFRRRMVRAYLPDPVDPAILDSILDSARQAPSAGFTQAVELVVVTSPAGRRRLAAAAGEADYVARGHPGWLSSAPVHVVISVEPDAYRRRYAEADKVNSASPDGWPVPYWWIDAGTTLMLMLLAATDAGLAAGFLGSHAFADLGGEVGLPPTHVPIGLVTIGHPVATGPVGSALRPRRPRRATEHAERWGNPRRSGGKPATS